MERNSRNSYRQSARTRRRSSGDFPHVLLFYVLPFIVFNGILFFIVTSRPKITLEVADTNDYLSTEATLTVRSWYPTKSVKLSTMDGELEPVKGKGRTYTVYLNKNGVLEAEVVNLNGMSSIVYEQINILDENPPAIEDARIEDGVVTLTVTDSQSGVDFDSIYALDANGRQVEPVSGDRNTNTISFEMNTSSLQVYAKDKAGLEVHGSFSTHKEGDVEQLESSSEPVEVSVE